VVVAIGLPKPIGIWSSSGSFTTDKYWSSVRRLMVKFLLRLWAKVTDAETRARRDRYFMMVVLGSLL
jgi:hypothetical protein